jgi:hypothetical protein
VRLDASTLTKLHATLLQLTPFFDAHQIRLDQAVTKRKRTQEIHPQPNSKLEK